MNMRASAYLGSLVGCVICLLSLASCSDSGNEGPNGGDAGGASGAQSSSGGSATAIGGTTGGGATTTAGSAGASSGGGNGGAPASGGASAGTTNGGTGGTINPDSQLGTGTMEGSGSSDEQYETAFVSRNETPYILITNGWGPGFESHTISWEGTSFTVESMSGTPGDGGQPASYPTVFCGKYSVMQVPDCGLPATRESITTLRTGWRWAANGNTGDYNAAYDIWVGNGTQLQGYLMVWLRDPPGEQPAGQPDLSNQGITVQNVPGTWNIWTGTVNTRPIINWVRPEGQDSSEIEFDVMDFVRDAETRGFTVPGTHINAVAVGFEIWEGPISDLESVDFYVEVN
jgi:hypothetical protein